MKFHLIAASALLVGSTAVLAQEAEDSEAREAQAAAVASAQAEDEAAAEEEQDPGEEVICRTERVTGSLTRRTRTCMTRNEWNGVHDRTRNELNRMGRNAAGGAACRMDQQGGC